ncbi:Cro/Cl family transcriptional regulator, partial [Escherichia coli]|uniref:Cro/Cl family transcriptional regulator n=1 Tax=Escherichia coli TaxID=562 RepID=UPI001C02CCA4
MNAVDKRTINGNNGTVRTEDKKQRKRPSGYYVLKDEVRAGLRARLEIVLDFFGTKANMAKQLKVTPQIVEEWFNRGMIS